MRAAWMLAVLAGTAPAQDGALLIRNATIHPVTSPPVENASLLVRDGMIAEIGAKIAAPKGTAVVEGRGLHVYPGMIDSGTTLGMAEIGSVRETSDVRELGEFNPQLRSLIAVNPSSEHIPVARANGITMAVTLPGGGIIAGQAGLVQLDGWTWEEMAVRPAVATRVLFPVLSTVTAGEFFERRRTIPYEEARRKHEADLQKLRLFVEDARRYQREKEAGATRVDLKFEAMLPVLEGKRPLMITAVRERAIREALEFTRREKLRMILAEPREMSQPLLKEVKERSIPVILGPVHSLPLDEDSPYDSQYTFPAELLRAGILFAFASFESDSVRNLPYQAAAAVAYGLPHEEALKAVTINAARIWGVDDQTGSIETGKRADLILTDGDPLETRTQVKLMLLRGRRVSLESKHTRLYEKYMARP